MAVDGRGACVVYYQPTIPRPSAVIPQVYPDTRPPGNGHVTCPPHTGRRPPCLIVTPTHHPPAREIRCAILGPGSGDAPDGGPAAVREARGLPEAYRWGCGGTGVHGGGRVVIVVATGITWGMQRGSADTYVCDRG